MTFPLFPASSGAARKAIAVILAALAFIAPLLSIFAPLGMAPLVIVGAAAILIVLLIGRLRPALPGKSGFLLLSTLVVWGAISALWSVQPQGSLLAVGQLAGLVISAALLMAGATMLDETGRRSLLRALTAGIVLAIAIFAIERAFDAPILSYLKNLSHDGDEQLYSPYNRSISVLLLTTLPAMIGWWRGGRVWFAAALFAASAAVTYSFFGASIQVALTLAVPAAALLALSPKRLAPVLGVICAAALFAIPFVASTFLTPAAVKEATDRIDNLSVAHRLVIWNFASERIAEKPILGWGFDTARAMPGGKTRQTVTLMNNPARATQVESLPLHPHNMALQWRLELGLPGAALAALFAGWLLLRCGRASRRRVDAALASGLALIALGIGCLSYGAWQSWWLGSCALSAALAFAMLGSGPKRAAFLDRDGTIVEEVDYLTRPEQLRLLPGAAAAIRRLNEAGWLVVVATNQSAVARGMLSEDGLAAVHARLKEMLAAEGARLDGIYYCPHLPDGSVADYARVCDCRKPAPGLLQQAARDLGIDLPASAMIGDGLRDLQAGMAAGCSRLFLVRSGHGAAEETAFAGSDLTDARACDDLAAAVELLEESR